MGKAPTHYNAEYKRLEESLRKAQAETKASEERFRNIIHKNADGIIIIDRNSMLRFINPAGERIFDRQAEELQGTSFGFPVVSGETTELTVIRRDGNTVFVEMRVVDTEWEGESVYLASMRDITRRKRAEEQLLHDAFHNALTGLPNRALLMDRLGRAFERMKRSNDFSSP